MVWEIVFMLLILKIPARLRLRRRLVGDQGRARAARRRGRQSWPTRPRRVDRPGGSVTASAGRCVRTHRASAAAPRHLGARLAAETECAHDAPSTLLRIAATSSTDVVAGFLAVASIVLSLFAMGLGLILEVDARPARTALRRDHPRARLGAAERPLPVARAQGRPLRDGRVGRRDDARRDDREPADLELGAVEPLSACAATGTTHRMSGADLSGLNAGYVAQMLEAYLDAPASVPQEWRDLFERDPAAFAGSLPGPRRPAANADGANGAATAAVGRLAAAPAPAPPRRRRCAGSEPAPQPPAPAPPPRRRTAPRLPPTAEPEPRRRSDGRSRRRSTRSSSAASPRRWRSSRPTGCTGISPRGSTRSAPSRWVTRRSTSPASSRP